MRMFLASVAVILLTLVLGGAFVGDAVRGNFSRYTYAEAGEQAYDLGLYLEAWLNRSSNQDDPGWALDEFFAGHVDHFTPYNPDDDEGPAWGDWIEIAAETLTMPVDALHYVLEEQSLEDICWERNVLPEVVLAAIMRYEMNDMEEQGYEEADSVDELAGVLSEAHDFMFTQPQQDAAVGADTLDALPERLAWFLDALVDDARIIATDPDGLILFDSHGDALGVQVDKDLFATAAKIYDWRTGIEMCAIIVAAGPGHYQTEANSFLSQVQRSLFNSAAILLVAAVLLSYWFGRRFLKPIQALTDATARLSQGDSDGRLPIQSEDEVGGMSASFNHMLDSLEEQRALRKRLVADLAHELNTPLSVIQLELAGLEAGMQTPEECSARIGTEVEVLKRLAEDVRLLTDSDRGALQLVLTPCDVVACCNEAVDRWQSRASEKQIELKYIGASSLPEVHADRLRVVQVLGNLLGNAVRHCDLQGSILVDAQARSTANGQSAIQISVKDNGEGIPSDQLNTIFERFTRADSARSRDTAGRGLGLAIVADLIESHGGRVWVESEVGVGSTFRFLLPL